MLTAAAVLAAPFAYATSPSDDDATGMCAKVKKTTDGWLALRKGPTTSAPLIVKLGGPTKNSSSSRCRRAAPAGSRSRDHLL